MDDPGHDDNASSEFPSTKIFLLRIWAQGPKLLGHLSLPSGQRIGSFSSGESLVRLLGRETGLPINPDDRKD